MDLDAEVKRLEALAAEYRATTERIRSLPSAETIERIRRTYTLPPERLEEIRRRVLALPPVEQARQLAQMFGPTGRVAQAMGRLQARAAPRYEVAERVAAWFEAVERTQRMVLARAAEATLPVARLNADD